MQSNCYNSGASCVDWHADSEPMFQGCQRSIVIISLSLGAQRTFRVKYAPNDEKDHWRRGGVTELQLRDGDICSMEGQMQKYYKHSVPKESAEGPRINLTWRWVITHSSGCTADACIGPEVLPTA